MMEYQTSYKQKLESQKEDEKGFNIIEVDKNKPYLQNLSEDPLLDGKVLYGL